MTKSAHLKTESAPEMRPTRGRPENAVADASTTAAFQALVSAAQFSRDGNIALWVQLKNLLAQKISDGSLPANARLPSELAMAQMFKLSRPVIRNALSALVSEGRITKQARKGIFVSAPETNFDFMTSATGVFDDLSAKGMEVEERTYEFGLFPAEDREAQALRLPEGFKVIRFVRVYVADGRPITHSRISLPAHRLPSMEKFEMSNKSIFGTIREHFGLTVAKADRWIGAAVADAVIAKRLEVAQGHPLLDIHSIALDHDGLPLEFYQSFYNPSIAPIHLFAEAGR